MMIIKQFKQLLIYHQYLV